MAMLVRTTRPVGEMTIEMRRAIARVDPEQAAYGFMSLAELMNSELSLNVLNLKLLGGLSVVAVLLAVLGVYGVTAQAVRQRTREIAIRLALGLTPGAVKRLLLRESGLLLAISFAVGAAAPSGARVFCDRRSTASRVRAPSRLRSRPCCSAPR
jgi:predicted lysophospholipase L1 biosynthesis ABC-type transport system permease subunit